jgi:hypothetical protein
MGREEFRRFLNATESAAPPIDQPWLPFRSREDFEFAEIAHRAAMNQPQIESLIKLIRRCEQNPGQFTLENFRDLKVSWEKSSELLTNVSAFVFIISSQIFRLHPTAPFLVRVSHGRSHLQGYRAPVQNLGASTLGMDFGSPSR